MPLFAWLAGALSSFFASSVARYLALKVILTTLFVVILPVILNNFAWKLLDIALSYISGIPGLPPFVMHFTGLSAYFVNHLMLVQVFAIIIGAIMTRFTLKLIPFVRV
jgi:hypothetical protein